MKSLENTITFSPTTLPPCIVGVPYIQEIIMSGGTEGYNDPTIQGSMPPGLSISRNGNKLTVSGTPTSSGNYPFTIIEIGGQDIAGAQNY